MIDLIEGLFSFVFELVSAGRFGCYVFLMLAGLAVFFVLNEGSAWGLALLGAWILGLTAVWHLWIGWSRPRA